MTLSAFLQGIISIVFIYLILSLFTSELQEYLATLSEARAKRLKQSIRQMLGEEGLRFVDKDVCQYCSPSYSNNNETIASTWESNYSLQDEELIRAKQGLQQYRGTAIANSCKAWIQENAASQVRQIHQVQTPEYVVSDKKDPKREFIWIQGNQELSAATVIEDDQNPEQGFVKNLKRYPVMFTASQINGRSCAWLKGQILTPVADGSKSVTDYGHSYIWINDANQQELPAHPIPTAARPYPVYATADARAIPQGSKVWIQDNELHLILPADQRKIISQQDPQEEWVWIHSMRGTIVNPSAAVPFVLSPDEEETIVEGSDKTIMARKSTVYQLEIPLNEGTRYYKDRHNRQIRAPLPVASVTEKIYQHPNIRALNQSAFPWHNLFGLYLPPSPFKLSGWTLEHRINLVSTLILVLFFISLFAGNSFWLFIFFLFFWLVRFLYFFCLRKYAIPGATTVTRPSEGPSYIEDSNLFVDTLIDVLKKESDVKFHSNDISGIKKTLETLGFYTPAQSFLLDRVDLSSLESIQLLKQDLKQLFEEVQKRSAGVYKRNAKGLSLFVGFLIAVLLNADTFHMFTSLTREDSEFGKSLIRKLQAEPTLIQPCPQGQGSCSDAAKQEKLKDLIGTTGVMPLGWNLEEIQELETMNTDLEKRKAKKRQEIKALDERRTAKLAAIKKNKDIVDSLTVCSDPKKDCLGRYAEIYSSTPPDTLPAISPEETTFLMQEPGLASRFADLKEKKLKQARLLQLELLRFDSSRRTDVAKLNREIVAIDQEINDLAKRKSMMHMYQGKIAQHVQTQGGWLKVFSGWLITAIALSMGAPFWFDLLGRVMNVRNAGKSSDSPATESENPDKTNKKEDKSI